MPTAQINGITLNYQIDGSDSAAETIVLINGLADDLESWGSTERVLTPRKGQYTLCTVCFSVAYDSDIKTLDDLRAEARRQLPHLWADKGECK